MTLAIMIQHSALAMEASMSLARRRLSQAKVHSRIQQHSSSWKPSVYSADMSGKRLQFRASRDSALRVT
ncbi:hypothetical protein HQ394_08110 [Defluviicoccus vanus]|uniref:Uncharacterized protein n=1 Tax=Defluviicoccus vanus TaxID=111831 RepID=A0A7H1N0Q6_9PROT|nr:hypothetical protein HQ394_08110 [Defluviicoccus vanus]